MAVDDSYTKLLLHCDGADGASTFTDEAGKTVTRVGNAQIDTAQYKFGGASGYFDGNGDYLTVPDSADWQLDGGSNSNSWTIDFWTRHRGLAGGSAHIPFLQFGAGVTDGWSMRWISTNFINFRVYSGGSTVVDANFSANYATYQEVWVHIALVKQGTTGYKCFLNGTQIGSTIVDTSTIPSISDVLAVGYVTLSGSNHYYGWLDELRISKGIARWTSNFTPPTTAYEPSTSNGNFFQLF